MLERLAGEAGPSATLGSADRVGFPECKQEGSAHIVIRNKKYVARPSPSLEQSSSGLWGFLREERIEVSFGVRLRWLPEMPWVTWHLKGVGAALCDRSPDQWD